MTKAKFVSVTLRTPIVRGDKKIDTIKLREPKAGEMRGLNMVDLVQLQVDAVQKLTPRISDPPLLDAEMMELTPGDLMRISTEIANFLLPEEVSEASPET